MGHDIARYLANVQDELNGAALYSALAAGQSDIAIGSRPTRVSCHFQCPRRR